MRLGAKPRARRRLSPHSGGRAHLFRDPRDHVGAFQRQNDGLRCDDRRDQELFLGYAKRVILVDGEVDLDPILHGGDVRRHILEDAVIDQLMIGDGVRAGDRARLLQPRASFDAP